MNSRERVLTALDRKQPDAVPFLEIAIDEEVGFRLLGTTQEKERFLPMLRLKDSGARIGPMRGDGLYLYKLAQKLHLDGFGFRIEPPLFVKTKTSGGREYIVDGKIKTRENLVRIRMPDPDDTMLYAPARKFLDNYKDTYAAFAVINIGPEPAMLSMGQEHFFISLYENKNLVKDVLNLYCDWTARALKYIQDMDFDFIWSSDDLAYNSGPMFSPQMFQSIVLPPMRQVAQNITLPWIFHSDGNLMPILDDIIDLGISALHPIEPKAMDIIHLKQAYGGKICLVGNIDLNTLSRGTPQEVEEETRRKIRKVGPGGGYIVSSGNSITSYCKPENVLAMSQAILHYGTYPVS